MNKQYLIEKIVPLEDDRGTFRAEHGHGRGWNDCRSQVLKNISSLDLNGWVRVEEIREWADKRIAELRSVYPNIRKYGGKDDGVEGQIKALSDILKHLSTLAPQEENKD